MNSKLNVRFELQLSVKRLRMGHVIGISGWAEVSICTALASALIQIQFDFFSVRLDGKSNFLILKLMMTLTVSAK